MKTYVFKIEIEQEDARWVANVPSLPGCIVEGNTRSEALEALKDATQAYLEVLFEDGDTLPQEAEEGAAIVNALDVVAVTV